MEIGFIILVSFQAITSYAAVTIVAVNTYKDIVKDKFQQRLRNQLEKNREWYTEDKTIMYEVNPMFNKLCHK